MDCGFKGSRWENQASFTLLATYTPSVPARATSPISEQIGLHRRYKPYLHNPAPHHR